MKIFIALIVIGLIAAGFWFMDFQQKHTELEQLEASLKQSEEKLTTSKEKIKRLPELTEKMQALERELQSLIASKFQDENPEMFVANYIADVERLVLAQQEATGDYTFAIQSISPGQQQSTQTPTGSEGGGATEGGGEGGDAAAPEPLQGFPTRVFSMTMNGQYRTLVDFLRELGDLKLDRLVTINKITLSPTSDKVTGEKTLNISIPITAYLRQGG
jgi:Tfp pilus assembly protein PilO